VQDGLLTKLHSQDPDGDLLALVLERCAPPFEPTPAVLWRCAASARFLVEHVQQVRSRCCNSCVKLVQLEATNPTLRQWKVGSIITIVLLRVFWCCFE
tara:strand:+ start:50 stop:343 length:294 start_codon:yes stop_codon:yes gene_type:complete